MESLALGVEACLGVLCRQGQLGMDLVDFRYWWASKGFYATMPEEMAHGRAGPW